LPGDSVELRRTLRAEDALGAPVSLEVVVGVVFVTDLLGTPFRVLTIDRLTGVVRSRFGREGDGPGELLAPSLTSLRLGAEGLEFSIWDQGRSIAEFGVYDPVGDTVRSRSSLQLRNTGQQLAGVVVLDDEVFASTVTGTPALVQLDLAGAELRRFESEAPFAPDTPGPDAALNRTLFAVHDSSGQAVLAFRYAPWIDLIDLATSQVRPRHFAWDAAELREAPPASERPGYTDVVVTARYVYGLYKRAGEDMAATVHRYTWDGLSVAELELGASLSAIAVPPGDTIIYGAIVEPVPAIGEWLVR
jgi:hypothetical protein